MTDENDSMAEEQPRAPARPRGQRPEPQAPAKKPINRREFLNIAWLASLGILTIDMGVVTYFFALPRFKEGEFGGTFTLGPAVELPPENVDPIGFPKGRFWLARTNQGVLALFMVCTHLGCLYQWQDAQGIFRCPCHGSRFSYDGTYIGGPAPRSLDRFVVQAVDANSGEIVAETDPEGGPLAVPDSDNIVVRVDTGNKILGKPR